MLNFKELINIESFKKNADNMHSIIGITIALTDTERIRIEFSDIYTL